MDPKHLWHGTVAFGFVAAGIGIVSGTAYLLYGGAESTARATSTSVSISEEATTTVELVSVPNGIRFECANDKSLVAGFSPIGVQLSLSDGRNLTLPQTISGSGARYANADESFVFWNKGNTAFIEEHGATTYEACETRQFDY